MGEKLSVRLNGDVGDFRVDLEFEAPAGRVTALFGTSGCGKTTTLRAVAGLCRLAGHVRFGTETWQDRAQFVPPHRRGCGYVMQEANLFPHLSVRENLTFASRFTDQKQFSFDEVIEWISLKDLLDRPVTGLSGGQRQRVSIGRALLSQPRVVLLDEPLSGLDRSAKAEMLRLFVKLKSRLEMPIIYVSHDHEEIAAIADQVCVMEDGRITATGAAETVLSQPLSFTEHDPAVVVPAVVTAQERDYGLTKLALWGQTVSVPALSVETGQIVRLRIRAREVAISPADPENISIRNRLKGEVREIIHAAGSAYSTVIIAIAEGRLASRITRKAVDELRLEVGMQVYALIKTMSFE